MWTWMLVPNPLCISFLLNFWVELPGHKVSICLVFWGIAWLFQALHHFTSNVCGFQQLCILQHLLLSIFLVTVILVPVKWYPVALNWIFLMTNDIMHLSMCLLAIVYLLWRSGYSNLWPNFNWVIGLFINWVVRIFYIFWI